MTHDIERERERDVIQRCIERNLKSKPESRSEDKFESLKARDAKPWHPLPHF
jgi:hypothetical protein